MFDHPFILIQSPLLILRNLMIRSLRINLQFPLLQFGCYPQYQPSDYFAIRSQMMQFYPQAQFQLSRVPHFNRELVRSFNYVTFKFRIRRHSCCYISYLHQLTPFLLLDPLISHGPTQPFLHSFLRKCSLHHRLFSLHYSSLVFVFMKCFAIFLMRSGFGDHLLSP